MFKIGDEVRIAKAKRHFEKGYTPNWTEEVFVIDQILPTHPVTYRKCDLANKPIVGSFTNSNCREPLRTCFASRKCFANAKTRF